MTEIEPKKPEIRAVEFFSGIGGMHFSLQWTGIPSQVVAAFDINPHANQCYKHFFGLEPVQKNIENITYKFIDGCNANMWLCSPPCQPFTRSGPKKESKDPRALGFSRLLELLKSVKLKPKFFFLENVLGFENSDCHETLLKTLNDLGYGIKEWILTPTQFGIPNQRERYYLFATLGAPSTPLNREWAFKVPIQTLASFLDPVLTDFIPVVWDRALDPGLIVRPESTSSGCFTKGISS